jgi:hypothetical protein
VPLALLVSLRTVRVVLLQSREFYYFKFGLRPENGAASRTLLALKAEANQNGQKRIKKHCWPSQQCHPAEMGH